MKTKETYYKRDDFDQASKNVSEGIRTLKIPAIKLTAYDFI